MFQTRLGMALLQFPARPASRLIASLGLGGLLLLQAGQGWGQTSPGRPSGPSRAVPPNALPPLRPSGNLRVLRSFQIQQLTPGTLTNLGGYQINLESIRRFSSALDARANALRQLGSLAQVLNQQSTISELQDGLLISTELSYSVQLGACLQQSSALARAGIGCRRPAGLEQSIAALSDPGSDRYIADASKRREAVQKLQAARQDTLQIAAQARQALLKPNVAQTLGGGTAQALRNLNDDQLANELFNAGHRRFEEAIYIPSAASLQKFKRIKTLQQTDFRSLQQSSSPSTPVHQSAAGGPAEQREIDPILLASTNLNGLLITSNNANTQVKRDTFLAGFTLGKDYEWRKRFSVTVDPCFWPMDDCPRTYFLEPFAKFGYGLGLRFPIRSALTYEPGRNGQPGSITAEFVPFDGAPADYTAAGLSRDQLFEGQELVAELSAEAGFSYKVPGSRDTVSFNIGRDLTDKLPAPFTGGNFTPPSPERPLPMVAPIFIDDIDLLFGNANFGVVWAKLHPGLKADLTSRSLNFKLVDNLAGNSSQTISSGQRRSVTAENNQTKITLKDPKYNVTFTITPGIQYKVGVDLLVWEDSYKDSIWLPQLSVTLPPQGGNFSCHAGTRCSQTYTFRANSGGSGPAPAPNQPGDNPWTLPNNQPGQPPARQRLDGWWRGDRSGFYSIQTSGSDFQMKGFTDSGEPFKLFTGTINRDTISGSWRNFCNDRTGQAVLAFNNGVLTRMSGSAKNNSWARSNPPATVKPNPRCPTAPAPNPPAPTPPANPPHNPPAQAVNLSGTWIGNDGGTYTFYQSGNTLSWRGRGGNFRNTFTGQIRGNTIQGYWQDTAGSVTQNSGQITLRFDSANELVRISHTGAFTGTRWTRR